MMMNIPEIFEGVKRHVIEIGESEIIKIFSDYTVEVKYKDNTIDLSVYGDNGESDTCQFTKLPKYYQFTEGKRFLDYETASKIMKKHFPTLAAETAAIRSEMLLDLEIY